MKRTIRQILVDRFLLSNLKTHTSCMSSHFFDRTRTLGTNLKMLVEVLSIPIDSDGREIGFQWEKKFIYN